MPTAKARRVRVRHPMLEVLANVPVDDEPVTKGDERDIRFARAEARRGKLISHDKASRSLTSKGAPKERRRARA